MDKSYRNKIEAGLSFGGTGGVKEKSGTATKFSKTLKLFFCKLN
jgi:hypothetical protein